MLFDSFSGSRSACLETPEGGTRSESHGTAGRRPFAHSSSESVSCRRTTASVDRPGVARAEERGEIAFALLLLRLLELSGHLVVVDGTLDCPEDPKRRRPP